MTTTPENAPLSIPVRLRAVTESDLFVLFEQQRDPEANQMAAFTAPDPGDRTAFLSHWKRVLSDESIQKRIILVDEPGSPTGRVAGYLVAFQLEGQLSVGYWLGRNFWGKGIATQALSVFLATFHVRPLYARTAKDNLASLRVLQKCGFQVIGEDRGFAQARGTEIDEWVLRLEDVG